MNSESTRKAVQNLLHCAEDGVFGPKTLDAYNLLAGLPDSSQWPPDASAPTSGDGWHSVKASSFADPADVAAFRRCKNQGGSDQACFKVGDNGVGKWGDDCSQGSGPACALPPEDWGQFPDARGKKVVVRINGVSVFCNLKDTMPHKANITNGAGIDLNPDTVAELGQRVPLMIAAEWRWA